MDTRFLLDLVIILGVSAVAIVILHRLKAPPLTGFIIAGLLIGPHGLQFITNIHEVEYLAEIGVILLLFTVGLEFSLKHLVKMWRAIVFGGGGQVILSMTATAVIAYMTFAPLKQAILIGMIVSLSSTAIVLKMLLESGEADSPAGRNTTGILIFQDLCVVPFMMLVPILAGTAGESDTLSVVLTFLKAMAFITLVLLSAKWAVPHILHQVVHTRSRELFIITLIILCLGIALLTAKFGLSLALGAFLAGLIISESEYAHQATADILPFKDSFMGLFFVSIGMLINMSYILSNAWLIMLVVLAIFLIKTFTATIALVSASIAPRVALCSALSVSQIGEFSFIVAGAGKASGLLTDDLFQLILAASVITMLLSPFLIRHAPGIATAIVSIPLINRFVKKEDRVTGGFAISEHVIIIGFGLSGKHLAKTLRTSDIPYVVLDLNSATIREEMKKGEPIMYGDGTKAPLLHKLGIDTAKLLVVAISAPYSARKIVSLSRFLNPEIHIVVRTRYLSEVDDLLTLGANEVIPEEFETSIEIFSRVLNMYNVPKNVIIDRIESIRDNAYKAFRTTTVQPDLVDDLSPVCLMESFNYQIKDTSGITGCSIKELNLRRKTGTTIMAVQRKGDIFKNPDISFRLRKDDILLLFGSKDQVSRAFQYMDTVVIKGAGQSKTR